MKKEVNVDVKIWSNDSDIDIVDYNIEDDGDSLTITATVKVYLEFGEWVSFDLDFTVDDLDDIDDDEIYDLDDVNNALKKVDQGGSKGKTLIKIE